MSNKEELAMNAAGVAELGFPMWPQFDPKTKDDVAQIIESGLVNYWTGKKGMEFEEAFCKWAGAKMAVSCTNGTAALHIGLASLGIGPGDEVLVPSYSFIASSFAVVQAGAVPIFCDVTEDHTIDPADIERKITPRTKGIVVVHLYGVMCDMERILDIGRRLEYAKMYDAAFTGMKGIAKLPLNTPDRENGYWWYPIIIDTDAMKLDAPAIVKKMVEAKIPCYGIQWPEAYEELAYREMNGFGTVKFPFHSKEYAREGLSYTNDLCPVAKSLRARTVNLFLHPTWEKEHIQRVIDVFTKVIADNLK